MQKVFRKFIQVVLLYLLVLFVIGCQHLTDDENQPTAPSVKVSARSANANALIFPVRIFAFSQDGICVAQQSIKDDKEAIDLQLSAQSYRIVAISGLTDDYSCPSNPTLTDRISIQEKGASNALMMGSASITVSNAQTLTIAVDNVVASVSVTLTALPEGTKNVQLAFSPLYGSLTFGAEYLDAGQKVVIPCAKNADNTWKAEGIYVFPGTESKTEFLIKVTDSKGEDHIYSYTYNGAPKANHPFVIQGNYDGSYTIDGDVVAGDWDDSIDASFDFGNSNTPPQNEEPKPNIPEKTEEPEGDIPSEGTIWRDCVVMKVTKVQDGYDLLLMGTKEFEVWAVEAISKVSEYSLNGWKWRLPSDVEAKQMRDMYNGDALKALNNTLKNYDATADLIEDADNYRYACLKEGTVYSFRFVLGSKVTPAGEKMVYLARPVTKVTIMQED